MQPKQPGFFSLLTYIKWSSSNGKLVGKYTVSYIEYLGYVFRHCCMYAGWCPSTTFINTCSRTMFVTFRCGRPLNKGYYQYVFAVYKTSFFPAKTAQILHVLAQILQDQRNQSTKES